MKYIGKKFFIENVKASNLAKKYSTPLYCYSYKKLKENITNFKKTFKTINPLICFAVKSNSNTILLSEIRKLGLGADVVSIGELMKALKAGINPNKIVFLEWQNIKEIDFAKKKYFHVSQKRSFGNRKNCKIKKRIVSIGGTQSKYWCKTLNKYPQEKKTINLSIQKVF